jgi:hypothetical protein
MGMENVPISNAGSQMLGWYVLSAETRNSQLIAECEGPALSRLAESMIVVEAFMNTAG